MDQKEYADNDGHCRGFDAILDPTQFEINYPDLMRRPVVVIDSDSEEESEYNGWNLTLTRAAADKSLPLDFAELLILFSRDHFNRVGKNVIFRDPVYNVIHIVVHKMSESLFFTHGWTMLRDVYHLEHGAWLRLYFLDENEFILRIYDRFMNEIIYPEPSYVYHHEIDAFPSMSLPQSIPFHEFHHITVDKVLTDKQTASYCMSLPVVMCEGIHADASSIVFRDEQSQVFECAFRWAKRRRNEG
ncbi:DNA-binding barrel domain superfamily, partial [Sesbania bispinosa]